MADTDNNPRTPVLGDALDVATERILEEGKSPQREVKTLDNRGSHFYLAMFWARALADQKDDADLAALFAPVADALEAAEDEVVKELNDIQGTAVELGGHYHLDEEKANAVMRPVAAFNKIIDDLAAADNSLEG